MPNTLATGESAVQDAIVVALAEYCYAEHLRFRHTLPYSNQQGFNPTKLCADMVAILSDAILLVLEIKAANLTSSTRMLASFDDTQWREYQHFGKNLMVPVYYAFNHVETLAHALPGPFSAMMCAQTLGEIALALPSKVTNEGKVQKISCSLFQYLRKLRQTQTQSGAGSPSHAGTTPRGVIDAERLSALIDGNFSNSTLVLAVAPDSSIVTLSAAQLMQLKEQLQKIDTDIDKNNYPALAEYMKLARKKRDDKAREVEEAKAAKRTREADVQKAEKRAKKSNSDINNPVPDNETGVSTRRTNKIK
jgi:hypothetical protein